MLWISIKDGYSRENDAHLHTHVGLTNITKYKNKFMALRVRKILQHDFNRTWGNYYRMILAKKVRELEYSISYVKGGEWRLDKISYACEKEFSKRRQQIADEKKKNSKINKKAVTDGWQERATRTNKNTIEENRANTLNERKEWINQAEFSIEAQQERANSTELERWILAIERTIQKSATASEEGVIVEFIAEEMRAGNWDKAITFENLKYRLARQVETGAIIKIKDTRRGIMKLFRAL